MAFEFYWKALRSPLADSLRTRLNATLHSALESQSELQTYVKDLHIVDINWGEVPPVVETIEITDADNSVATGNEGVWPHLYGSPHVPIHPLSDHENIVQPTFLPVRSPFENTTPACATCGIELPLDRADFHKSNLKKSPLCPFCYYRDRRSLHATNFINKDSDQQELKDLTLDFKPYTVYINDWKQSTRSETRQRPVHVPRGHDASSSLSDIASPRSISSHDPVAAAGFDSSTFFGNSGLRLYFYCQYSGNLQLRVRATVHYDMPLKPGQHVGAAMPLEFTLSGVQLEGHVVLNIRNHQADVTLLRRKSTMDVKRPNEIYHSHGNANHPTRSAAQLRGNVLQRFNPGAGECRAHRTLSEAFSTTLSPIVRFALTVRMGNSDPLSEGTEFGTSSGSQDTPSYDFSSLPRLPLALPKGTHPTEGSGKSKAKGGESHASVGTRTLVDGANRVEVPSKPVRAVYSHTKPSAPGGVRREPSLSSPRLEALRSPALSTVPPDVGHSKPVVPGSASVRIMHARETKAHGEHRELPLMEGKAGRYHTYLDRNKIANFVNEQVHQWIYANMVEPNKFIFSL